MDEEIVSFFQQPELRSIARSLIEDKEAKAYLDRANALAILRLGYNDHGEMHAKITAANALKILGVLEGKGIKPTILTEGVGGSQDARIAVLFGAYLHDIGCAISRDGHELNGIQLAKPIVERILTKLYDWKKLHDICCFIYEAILCHMGNYEATSLEARIVEVADGTDVTKERARIPFHIGRKDIHKFSALAIEEVSILEGEGKPIRIELRMENPAGMFQAEEIMLKKIRDAKLEHLVELVARIKGEKEIRYL